MEAVRPLNNLLVMKVNAVTTMITTAISAAGALRRNVMNYPGPLGNLRNDLEAFVANLSGSSKFGTVAARCNRGARDMIFDLAADQASLIRRLRVFLASMGSKPELYFLF